MYIYILATSGASKLKGKSINENKINSKHDTSNNTFVL